MRKGLKKRIIAIIMSFLVVFPLVACTDRDVPQSSENVTNKQDTEIDQDTELNYDIEVDISDEYDMEKSNLAAFDFAVRLMQMSNLQAHEPGSIEENILISPISVYLAMGMLENGAKGETLAQLEEVLGLNKGQMNSFASEYMKQTSNALKIANSIWYTNHEKFTVEEAFIHNVRGYYDADIYEAAFDNATCRDINQWVEDKTDGMIKDVLDTIPADAVMYLINALAFEARWEQKYEKNQVRDGVFYVGYDAVQEAQMMYSDEFLYLEDEDATGFIKYYAGKEYAFVALLPNEDTNVFNYIKNLSGEALKELLDNPVEVHVNAAIPQFETEYKLEMKDVLKEMGIVDVFEESKADLSGLGNSIMGNLSVDRVIHKTYIELTPVGTKAGAATVIEVKDECAMIYEETKEVILDRPFVYMIIDCENNQPIFMGTVNNINK